MPHAPVDDDAASKRSKRSVARSWAGSSQGRKFWGGSNSSGGGSSSSHAALQNTVQKAEKRQTELQQERDAQRVKLEAAKVRRDEADEEQQAERQAAVREVEAAEAELAEEVAELDRLKESLNGVVENITLLRAQYLSSYDIAAQHFVPLGRWSSSTPRRPSITLDDVRSAFTGKRRSTITASHTFPDPFIPSLQPLRDTLEDLRKEIAVLEDMDSGER